MLRTVHPYDRSHATLSRPRLHVKAPCDLVSKWRLHRAATPSTQATGIRRSQVQDDPRLEGYNAVQRADALIEAAQAYAATSRGRDVMILMGTDFTYSNALTWYKNMDRLIAAVNRSGRATAEYSTPERYLAAKAAAGGAWPLRTDDLFPYADSPHTYWTGVAPGRFADPPLCELRYHACMHTCMYAVDLLVITPAIGRLPFARQLQHAHTPIHRLQGRHCHTAPRTPRVVDPIVLICGDSDSDERQDSVLEVAIA